MKRKTNYIIIISLIIAFAVMSGGYGYWEEYLIIKGNIKVIEPPRKNNVKNYPAEIEDVLKTYNDESAAIDRIDAANTNTPVNNSVSDSTPMADAEDGDLKTESPQLPEDSQTESVNNSSEDQINEELFLELE